MTYSERVRHPDAALNPPRAKEQGLSWSAWILLGLIFLFLAYRMGWLEKWGVIGAKAMGTPNLNPQGWV